MQSKYTVSNYKWNYGIFIYIKFIKWISKFVKITRPVNLVLIWLFLFSIFFYTVKYWSSNRIKLLTESVDVKHPQRQK